MEQTGSKSGKEYIKAVYCHPAYLTNMQSTSCKMPGWMKCKLESRLQGVISVTSGMQKTLQIWKREHQGFILSPCLFSLYAEYIMRNAGLDEAQAGIKIAGRNINHLRYADDTTLWQKVKRN